MKFILSRFCIVAIASIAISCSSLLHALYGPRDVSPYDFGLASARTGVERYEVLLRAHTAAVSAGVNVNYSGIDSIDIEIPQSFKRIPLTSYNDFKGCVLNIRNT